MLNPKITRFPLYFQNPAGTAPLKETVLNLSDLC